MVSAPTVPHHEPWMIVCGGFHHHGGMDHANLALARYLEANGHQVTLVGHDFDLESSLPCFNPIKVSRLRSTAVGERLLSRIAARKAKQLVGKHSNARIVANGGNCLCGNVNWVHYVHHAWNPGDIDAPVTYRLKQNLLNKLYRRREKAAFRSAKVIIVNSQRTAQQVAELGIPPEKIKVIYLGCASELQDTTAEERVVARRWLDIREHQTVISFVGAISWDDRKGLRTLWSAMQGLWTHRGPSSVLVVAGDGARLSTWRAEIEKSPYRDLVRVLGFTKRVKDVLAASDLLVSPCRYEAFGLNVQEALCRGIPAVVSASAGVAELYPDELQHLLIPDCQDSNCVSEIVMTCLDDLALWQKRTRVFAESLRKRSWDDMAHQVVELAENEFCGPMTAN